MRRYFAEFLGSLLLLATVIGSGIMGETLSPDNDAVALLGNTIATGAILYVLITVLGPISGAHFNPAVTAAFWIRREIEAKDAMIYIPIQILGACAGVILANLMFDAEAITISQKVRTSAGQSVSEVVATFGLVFVILAGIKYRPKEVAALVGLYITSAYWFTASTSFANPAVTLARTLSDSFAGITPMSVIWFIAAQILGAILAVAVARLILTEEET